MCTEQNDHRHLGALHILCQQQPTDLDRRVLHGVQRKIDKLSGILMKVARSG